MPRVKNERKKNRYSPYGKPGGERGGVTRKQNKYNKDISEKLKDSGFVPYGANQSFKLFKPGNSETVGLKLEGTSKLAKMFDGKSTVVSPKKYNGEVGEHYSRLRQVLRWIATCTMTYLIQNKKEAVEVQLYCPIKGVGENLLYISTNIWLVNKFLSGETEGKSVKEFLSMILKAKPVNLEAGRRKRRHWKKLDKRISKGKGGNSDRYADVKKVLFGRGMKIITKEGGKGEHAECRIMNHIRDTAPDYVMKVHYMAGVKRMCVSCTVKIVDEEERKGHHSGPLWTSESSNWNVDGYKTDDKEYTELISSKITGTYVTLTREDGKVTDGWDTDSDSDEDLSDMMDD